MLEDQLKSRAAWLSVISNTLLVLGKVVIGLLIGSVSVLSEAIHSGVDLIAAFIALVAVKKASVPADQDHPYGHGKFENVSGTAEALLIFVAAGWIIYESVHKLSNPQPLEAPFWGVSIMLLSSVVNILVSRHLFRVGRETNSVALLADAWHLRTDVYTSAGVMGGLTVIGVGRIIWPQVNLSWVDPITAMAVALLILHAAYTLTRESARDLLDVSLPPEEERWIHECICGFAPPIRGYHKLRTRRSGAYRFIEFHMIVESSMSVLDSHNLAERVSRRIEDHFPKASVLVHTEPCEGECAPLCAEGCLVSSKEGA